MLIIPAIDLKDHKVVRLSQGKMDAAKIYAEDPVAMAGQWVHQGASRIHIVDLNGAFEGKPIHFKDASKIAESYPKIKVQVGGGIRSLETIEKYLDHGVDFCILGTVAIKNPDLVFEACQKFPNKIILGVDAKNGLVSTEGWGEVSEISALDIIDKFKDCSLESVIYTDIAKDGMLSGMNLEQIEQMKAGCFPVIASGGLTSLNDIKSLQKMGEIHGVIAGKAIYEHKFSLKEAIDLC